MLKCGCLGMLFPLYLKRQVSSNLGGKKSILKFFQNRSEKKVNPETKNHIFKGKKILWHSILQKQKYLLRQTVHIFPPNCFVYFPLFFAHCVGILSAKTILAYFKTS